MTTQLDVRSESLAHDFLSAVNYGINAEVFAAEVCNDHRTLQSRAVELMLTTILAMADNSTDLRNQAAVDACLEIAGVLHELDRTEGSGLIIDSHRNVKLASA
jgi:hypothetical protein